MDPHRRRAADATATQPASEYSSMETDGILRRNDDDDDHSHHHHHHSTAVTSPPPAQESHTRSLVKGLTWRILATSTTTVIAYMVTGHVEAALQIGFFEFFAKLLIYYAHERLWTKIRL